MPSNRSNRSAVRVRCHPMTTRSLSSWREASSSSESGSSESRVPDSSPDNSPVLVSDMANPSRKRRRSPSDSEEPEASSSSRRPKKKLKVSMTPASSPVESTDAEGSLTIRRPMKKLSISDKSSTTDVDSDDVADKPTSPSESEDEPNGGDDAFESPLPTLHVRSDGFWPTIRDYYIRSLEDESIRVDIPCVICDEECMVDGQWLWALRRPEGLGKELPVILCCGHVVGDECLETWRVSRRREGLPPNCPICRMSLRCSDCNAHMPGWPLTRDIPIGETVTLQNGGHRVTRCNGCEAENRFGDMMRLGCQGAGDLPEQSQLLRSWFDVARDRAAAEVRTGLHGNVPSRDVADLVLFGTFRAMRQALEDFEDEVEGHVQETLDQIEGDLDCSLPWNHTAHVDDEEDEDEEEEYYDYDDDDDYDNIDDWPGAPVGTHRPY
ncbi:hypothetical protein LZ32DRAFT_676033 [Colletotrichum eremochloae]|nr:hypothetical protein LZ32DRAFT_676033 [Colletotrichum eremochloae]